MTMQFPGSVTSAIVPAALPLALPEALWLQLTEDEQAIYAGAQTIIEGLMSAPDNGEVRIGDTGSADPDLLFGALHLLEEMGLVRVETDGMELGVTLLALPEEHICVQAPDASVRWVFVSRPLREPDWDKYDLN